MSRDTETAAGNVDADLDLLVAGNLLVDDIVYEDGRTRMAQAGGATIYVVLGACLWGIRVGILSVVGDDYPQRMLDDLAERGIDLSGLRALGRPGVRTWLLDEGRQRHVVHRLAGPTHTQVSPTVDDLEAGPRSRAVHLAPMPFDVQRHLVAALTQRPNVHVSLDPYELLNAEHWQAWKQLLAGVDNFLLSEDEMMIEGGLDRPRPILTELCGPPGAGRIFYKRGARGGIVCDQKTGRFFDWPARSRTVVDPTGAGDAFAGGVLAGHLLGEPLARALELGAVSAAIAVEGEGASALLAADPASARQRLQEDF